ncbi:hypothetical protein Ddye_032596 [Dipteronia dyeriana]|uniref:Disease resistance protein At4g27190-like leucine-rich repeats domain-containing protein n=1 Tax=Dipteronia dyeriana TaxID=168575 RepID=A0AAD9WJP0_9ROSI|nr:hypothetical protein Ddye_032596 [Dipteronia dyeriana]
MDNQLDISAKQPFSLFDKVFSNLEELTLNRKGMTVRWQGQFRKLKALQVVQDESSVFPLIFLQGFRSLEELVMRSCSYKEIFLHGDIEKHAGMLAKIKVLKFDALSELKRIWKQDSKMDSVLRNVEILHVWNCHNLIKLVPSSASLENLTTLNIKSCDGLVNLITPSTARSLVQLTKMSIDGCKMITEIVANEGDATRNDIILTKLKWLLLHRLPRLTSFCSGNYAFKFPSLEQLIVNECPGMKIFSRGVSSTPRLWKMQLSVDGNDEFLDCDVNTTIQRIHRTSGT